MDGVLTRRRRASCVGRRPPKRGGSTTHDVPLGRLPRAFYARPAPVVAKALVGMLLLHEADDGTAGGIIVEAEAYRQGDPASHSFRGKTARNAAMFGEPGHAYVYFSYGAHWCFNVVTGKDGVGEAVLVRALAPLIGVDHMERRRRGSRRNGSIAARDLARGPGRLTQALAITRSHDGADLARGPLGIWRPAESVRRRYRRIAAGPRVGITKGVETAWRFVTLGSPFVSGPSANRARQ